MQTNDSSFGAYRPTPLQRFVIEAARHSGPLHRALRNTASRLVQRLRPGPVDDKLFGLNVRFFPAENSGDRRALFTPNQFDRQERNLILRALPPQGVFLDIGANIGVYSLFVGAERPDVRVFAFEPSPNVFRKFQFNVEANGLASRIIARQIALSDQTGQLSFNSRSESLVLGEADIAVSAATLWNVVTAERIARIDAMKIDVEGAEDKVLFPFFEAAPRVLWPKLIVIEHAFPAQWTRDCLRMLEQNGYARQWVGKLNSAYATRA